MSIRSLKRFVKAGDYAKIKAGLPSIDRKSFLAAWGGFEPLEKLVLFKLLEPDPAMEFYAQLPFEEKYFLLCGFKLHSIAPILEKLPTEQRVLFVDLSQPYYAKMFHQTISERVDITMSIQKN